DDPEKGIIGIDDSLVASPNDDTDDIRIDETPNARLALPEVVVEAAVLERDRRLPSEQLENAEPGWREDGGAEIVFAVKDAEQTRLFDHRQAEHRTSLVAADVLVTGKLIVPRCVGKKHALLRPDDIVEN